MRKIFTSIILKILFAVFLLFCFYCKTPQPPPISKEKSEPILLEAMINFASGNVTSSTKALSNGDKISKGNFIKTDKESFADIQTIYPGVNLTTRLKSDSEITFDDFIQNGNHEIVLFVKHGESIFNTEVVDSKEKLTILTPAIVANLKSSSKFGIIVNKDGTTNLELYSGSASFRFALPEESEKFPFNAYSHPEYKNIIEETQTELKAGDKVKITTKQRNNFLKR